MTSKRQAEVPLGWSPHALQREVLTSDARFCVVAAGRRFGKTEVGAIWAAERADRRDRETWWVAPTYQQADIGWTTLRDVLPDAAIDDDRTHRSYPRQLAFVGGGIVSFRSADRPDSLRGAGLDALVVDEAAFVRGEVWREELRPTLMDVEAPALLLSTPHGPGWFRDQFEKGRSGDFSEYRSWQAPTEANPYISDEEVEQLRGELPDRVVQQEIEAQFLDSAGAIFTDIDAAWTDGHSLQQPPRKGGYVHGIDLARREDWTVIHTLDGEGRLIAEERMQDRSWSQIEQRIVRHVERMPGPVCIDATRDNAMIEDLRIRLETAVEGVQFTRSTKRELIEGLEIALEDGEVQLPDDAEGLRRELQTFEADASGRTVTYEAREGFHDDRVDALALACYGWRTYGRRARGGDSQSSHGTRSAVSFDGW